MAISLADKFDFGKLEIYYLKRIWSFLSFQDKEGIRAEIPEQERKYLIAVFNTLGIGLEPTLKYIYGESPSFEVFEDWIKKHGIVSKEIIAQFNSIILQEQNFNALNLNIAEEDLVLSESDLQHWDEQGYVIIKQAISAEACAATKAIIYDFIEAKESDPSTWYLNHPHKQGIMVQLFNNEQLNKNRLAKRIKTAYDQLWKRPDLLVSMDRVSFNPPETAQYQFPGPNLHWDVSLKQPIPFGLQGLLYLTDTSAAQGAFTLVPGFHRKIGPWLDALPRDTNPREFDFSKLNPKAIEGEAGDFIIWHQALPHGSSPNRAQQPRIVQYINYQPIEMEGHGEWV